MKGRLQGEDGGRYLPGGGGGGGHARQGEESVFDTPNPRSQPPRPAKFGGTKGACALVDRLFTPSRMYFCIPLRVDRHTCVYAGVHSHTCICGRICMYVHIFLMHVKYHA